MLAAGYSWRLYFYVLIAFSGALLIATFLFVEESTYKRNVKTDSPTPPNDILDKEIVTHNIEVVHVIPPRKTFIQTLKIFNGVDRDAEFFMTMLRSFTYFLVPSVLWVVTSFGEYFYL
jgi:hypothetical protein